MNECYEKFKLGCMLGGTVGASMGILFGSYSVLRHGHGGEGFIRVVGKAALESGGLFGLLMGVGGLIRCEPMEYDTNTAAKLAPKFSLQKKLTSFSSFWKRSLLLPLQNMDLDITQQYRQRIMRKV